MLTLKIPDKLQAKLGVSNVHEVLAILERGVSPSTYRQEQTLAAELAATKQRLSEAESKLANLERELAKPKKLLRPVPSKMLRPAYR